MSTAEFWKDMADKFSRIPGRVGCWCDTEHRPLFEGIGIDAALHGLPYESRDTFRHLATCAAVALGVEETSEAWAHWITRLGAERLGQWSDLHGDDAENIVHDEQGATLVSSLPTTGFDLKDVCSASRDLCRLLEARALAPQTSKKTSPPLAALARRPRALASWELLEIAFVSDERFQFVVDGRTQDTLNFAEFGLEDKRNGSPRKAWNVLRRFTEQGSIKPTSVQRSEIEKRVQEIRDVLRQWFTADGDPISCELSRYTPRFRVTKRPSFEA